MQRETLIKTLKRHIPLPLYGDSDYYLGAYCSCTGEQFEDEEAWARHVANAIYPE